MALSKIVLVQKFLSGEFKIRCDRRSQVAMSVGMTHEQVIQKFKEPICISQRAFWHLSAFLLSSEQKASGIDTIEGVNLLVETRCEHLHNYTGSRAYLVKLEDGDKYWGITENGIVQKSMTAWISYHFVLLRLTLTLNFHPNLKPHDPRFWVVVSMVKNQRKVNPELTYQTSTLSLESLYAQLEDFYKRMNQTLPDVAPVRMVYIADYSVGSMPPPNNKRKATDDIGPDPKKARKED